jgi:hypothetical protein
MVRYSLRTTLIHAVMQITCSSPGSQTRVCTAELLSQTLTTMELVGRYCTCRAQNPCKHNLNTLWKGRIKECQCSCATISTHDYLQAGTVSLEAVMGHLAPADDAMAAAAKDAAAALAREIRGIGVISLSATAAEPVCKMPATLPVFADPERLFWNAAVYSAIRLTQEVCEVCLCHRLRCHSWAVYTPA